MKPELCIWPQYVKVPSDLRVKCAFPPTGVLSSKGATNFVLPEWNGFDIRGALEARVGLPVIYLNDGNAAAMYAHHAHFGMSAGHRSSISAIVGTGLGGGVVEHGDVIRGASGMAGELGHVHIPMDNILEPGFRGDVESVASLTGIRLNLLPYWLTRYPDHPLASLPIDDAAKALRGCAMDGDEMARKVFAQQAMALANLFTISARFTDPHAYFVGGGVVEASVEFRDWFMGEVRSHVRLMAEQADVVDIALVPDLDMAGARGVAVAARNEVGLRN